MTYDGSGYDYQPSADKGQPAPGSQPATPAVPVYAPPPGQAPVYLPAPGDENPRYGVDPGVDPGYTPVHGQPPPGPDYYATHGPAFAPNPAYGAVAGPPPAVRMPARVPAAGFASGAAPAWPYIFVALAVLGGIGLILPWFRPYIVGYDDAAAPALHSWNGWIFFFAPIGMIACAVAAISGRRNHTQLRSLPRLALVTGAILTAVLIIHWADVPNRYSDWESVTALAKEHGLTVSYGPQLGFWLSAVAAAGYLGMGVFALIRLKRTLL